jgi:hypothetical protein
MEEHPVTPGEVSWNPGIEILIPPLEIPQSSTKIGIRL